MKVQLFREQLQSKAVGCAVFSEGGMNNAFIATKAGHPPLL